MLTARLRRCHAPGVERTTRSTHLDYTERGNPVAGRLCDQLSELDLHRVLPVRRVYIPRRKGKRPLGIPTIVDRCVQAMVKNALEPFWEARFEGSSYGFRPGRGCHDAIERVFTLARPNTTRPWVLDADIEGAFNNIGHAALLQTMGNFSARELIKQWLKARSRDRNTARAALGEGLAVSAFPRYVPV